MGLKILTSAYVRLPFVHSPEAATSTRASSSVAVDFLVNFSPLKGEDVGSVVTFKQHSPSILAVVSLMLLWRMMT